MSDEILLPPINDILERIRACREELADLKRLLRLAHAAQRVDQAQQRRTQQQEVAANG